MHPTPLHVIRCKSTNVSEATCFSKTFVGFQHSAWHDIPEDRTFQRLSLSHHEGSIWWALCLYTVFVHKALILRNLSHGEQWVESCSDILFHCELCQEWWVRSVDLSWESVLRLSLPYNVLLIAVLHVLWAGADNRFLYKYVGLLISVWLFMFPYLQHNQKSFSWVG
jgi:hypothetical protein